MSHSTFCRSMSVGIQYSLFSRAIVVSLLLSLGGCGAAQLGMCAPHAKEEGVPTQYWTECFQQTFSHSGITHSVFCVNDGTSKPPVLLLHELTGLTPGTLAYAEELSKDFTVYVPLLFGEKGKLSLIHGLEAYWFRGVIDFFPGGEWGTPSHGSAPIVNWLRGVVRQIGDRHTGQRIGLIGNCLTGPFPLALLDHSLIAAAVVAQPALPLRFWWYTDADKTSLGISDDDLTIAKSSTAKVYGLRFETDCMAPPEKYKTLSDTFVGRFIDGTIPAKAYQTDGKPMHAHSTLIGSWNERAQAGQASRDARERVRTFLLEELAKPRAEG